MWVHIILASSNVVFLPALIKAVALTHWWHALCVLTVASASVFMHVTETKHGLIPSPALRAWAPVALCIDRAVSISVTAYFLCVRFTIIGSPMVKVAVCGLVFSAVGELTSHLFLYVICHILWHSAAGFLLFVVV